MIQHVEHRPAKCKRENGIVGGAEAEKHQYGPHFSRMFGLQVLSSPGLFLHLQCKTRIYRRGDRPAFHGRTLEQTLFLKGRRGIRNKKSSIASIYVCSMFGLRHSGINNDFVSPVIQTSPSASINVPIFDLIRIKSVDAVQTLRWKLTRHANLTLTAACVCDSF